MWPSLTPVWSPDRRLIATEPIVPCEKGQREIWKCYKSSARVLVRRADGSHPRQVATGHFDSWTPDGRLLVTNRNSTASFQALEIDSGRRSLSISPRGVAALLGKMSVTIGPARWSADRRYIAAMLRAPWRNNDPTHGAFVVAHRDGRGGREREGQDGRETGTGQRLKDRGWWRPGLRSRARRCARRALAGAFWAGR